MKHILLPLSIAFALSASAENTTIYAASDYYDFKANADGQEIKFTYDGTVPDDEEKFFTTKFYNSELKATNGGTINLEANATHLFNSSVSVDGTSALNSAGIFMKQDATLLNHGTISANYIQIEGGQGTNYGTINDTSEDDELLKIFGGGSFANYGVINNLGMEIAITEGSAFYAESGSSMYAFDVGEWWVHSGTIKETSSLYISGNVDMYGALGLYDYGEIVFTLDSTLDMNGNSLTQDGGIIVLQLDGALTDSTKIYKKEFFTNSKYSVENLSVVVRGTNGVERTMTIKELAIPEPGTVTLSLLAMAGLVARRRRKH